MTDEELIIQLRQEGYDYFGTTYSDEAADRIEMLLEGNKGLAEAFATVSVKREMAEAKLARIAYRVDHITLDDAGKHLPDHPLDVWVLALNTAHRIVIEEMEKTE